MEKQNRYIQELNAWVKKKKSSRRQKNISQFLAVREDIKVAINEGYDVKTIWSHMAHTEKVTFGYDTFLNYVNRYLRQKTKNNTVSTHAMTHQKTPQDDKKIHNTDIPNFTFNPVPNKKDLI